MNKALLKIDKIYLTRNDIPIISDFSLDIFSSTVTNIYGRNGSGKTSLLKILVGITEPSSGSIINNAQVSDEKNITYVGHKYGIKSNLTVNENLQYEPITKKNKQATINNMITKFHMDEYKNYLTKYLSHGQQKKVSLIRASISDAKIWVIDEPYSALDKEAISMLDNCIIEHLKHDGVVIMTNHEAIDNKNFKVSNIKIDDE